MDLTHRIERERRKLSGVILAGGEPAEARKLNLDYELIDESLFYLLQMINAPDEEEALLALADYIEGQQDE